MNAKSTTQELEAEDLIDEMKTRLKAPTGPVACTPEAHAAVVGTERCLLRSSIWQIRHQVDVADTLDALSSHSGNGMAKIKVGPIVVSNVRAQQVGGILWKLIVLAFFVSIVAHQLGLKGKLLEALQHGGLPVVTVSDASKGGK
jgi:hypothetical protein